MDLLQSVEQYIIDHGLNITPEELFVQFNHIVESHHQFEYYLKLNGINENLEKMKRNKRLLEKRKLFVDWYFLKNQNKKNIKSLMIEASEMLFTSTKTIQIDLLKETTDK
ncbi:hypothetical protein [Changchengzhania lutea]|uniref:hypothetical protein n=1 Tax=Changchengzhania lutea TaxID=2049305 RepID=UPI00115D20B5|nr:hypothetical protein [Changchengzhania lutea]